MGGGKRGREREREGGIERQREKDEEKGMREGEQILSCAALASWLPFPCWLLPWKRAAVRYITQLARKC
jgi:hypothetical protein